MRLIDRYIALRFLGQSAIFFASLAVVLSTTQVLNEFHKFAGADQQTTKLLELFASVSPSVSVVVLPFALLVAAYRVMDTMIRDNEATTLHTLGIDQIGISKPIIVVTVFISLTVLGVSIFLEPIANKSSRDLIASLRMDAIQRAATSTEVRKISDDLFLWARSYSQDGHLNRVLIADSRDADEHRIYLANDAYIVGETRDKMIFVDGELHTKNLAKDKLSTVQFQRYVTGMDEFLDLDTARRYSARQTDTLALLEGIAADDVSEKTRGKYLAEMARRLSDWLYVLAFVGMALFSAGRVGSRTRPSNWALLIAFLLCVTVRIVGRVLFKSAGGSPLLALAVVLLPLAMTAVAWSLFIWSDRVGRKSRWDPVRLASSLWALWPDWSRMGFQRRGSALLSFSFGSTLFLYLFRQQIVRTLQCFIALLGFLYLGKLIEVIRDFDGNENATLLDALVVAALNVPSLVPDVIPYVVLFATGAVIFELTRSREHVALRAAGMSAWRFLTPFVLASFLVGVITVAGIGPLISVSQEQVAAAQRQLTGQRQSRILRGETFWLSQADQNGMTMIRAADWSAPHEALPEATFLRFDQDHRFIERFDSDVARLKEGYWDLQGVRVVKDGRQTLHPQYVLPSKLTNALIAEITSISETASIFTLPRKIDLARLAGVDTGRFHMRFHELLAFPMLLIAVTLAVAAATVQRTSVINSWRILMLGGAIALLLYVVRVVFSNLADWGAMSPMLAAWGPPAVICMIATTILLHSEDG